MSTSIILASGSDIRRRLLENAGIDFTTLPVKVDENAIKDSLIADGAKPRDIADALAEHKARKASAKQPDAYVIGCDQVLDFEGSLFSKPKDEAEARAQLDALNGKRHTLLSAAVVYQNGEPQWRHIGVVRLLMRQNSSGYLDDYVARNWHSIQHSVGGYKLEEEGVRLFTQITGDHFHVLGLPLIELLGYLTVREAIPG